MIMIAAELGPETESAVAELVGSGRFASEAEVLREGVRLLRAREAMLKVLDPPLQRGMADAAAGRTVPPEEVFAELKDRYQALEATREH